MTGTLIRRWPCEETQGEGHARTEGLGDTHSRQGTPQKLGRVPPQVPEGAWPY